MNLIDIGRFFPSAVWGQEGWHNSEPTQTRKSNVHRAACALLEHFIFLSVHSDMQDKVIVSSINFQICIFNNEFADAVTADVI